MSWRNTDVGGIVSLTNFLLARVAEDEHDATWAQGSAAERVLSDCEAKRQIVSEFEQVHTDYQVAHAPTLEGQRFGLLKAVAHLALPYAAHPDYRQEWKP